HGVKITDSALVAAATLSQRYITDRFLPDKAIAGLEFIEMIFIYKNIKFKIFDSVGGADAVRIKIHGSTFS
ncbi:MAG: hypothetical protein IIV40_04250, partial [Oscillospiraceae bacterium]|nr:hypothetical protein [Oscillospiraceae bacterium]